MLPKTGMVDLIQKQHSSVAGVSMSGGGPKRASELLGGSSIPSFFLLLSFLFLFFVSSIYDKKWLLNLCPKNVCVCVLGGGLSPLASTLEYEYHYRVWK